MACQVSDRTNRPGFSEAEPNVNSKSSAPVCRNRWYQRLVLVATREAVFASKPVEREVALFTPRSRYCNPIFFADTSATEEQTNLGKFVVLDRLPDDTLSGVAETGFGQDQGACP